MSKHWQADKHEELELRYRRACMDNHVVHAYESGRITAEQALTCMAEQIKDITGERVKQEAICPKRYRVGTKEMVWRAPTDLIPLEELELN